MDGPDAAPFLFQVLQGQAPVAMLRSGLTAQKHRRNVEEVPVQRLLDPTLSQEFEECPLVVPPFPAFPVGVQELAGRNEQGFVNVLRAAELLQEEREVGAAGKPGEPGRVIQPYVEETLDAGAL